jgi:hypothetical protein
MKVEQEQNLVSFICATTCDVPWSHSVRCIIYQLPARLCDRYWKRHKDECDMTVVLKELRANMRKYFLDTGAGSELCKSKG